MNTSASRRSRDRVPGKTTKRGYGHRHQQLRKNFARVVAMGGVKCARCGRPIVAGEKWDLGHDDFDRTRYTGPEHRGCNRRAGGIEGNRRLGNDVVPAVRPSRNW